MKKIYILVVVVVVVLVALGTEPIKYINIIISAIVARLSSPPKIVLKVEFPL